MNEEEKKEEAAVESTPAAPEENANKKMPKGAKVAIIVGASLVGFVAVLYLGVITYFRAPVAQYYNNSEKAFVIPGINDGLIGQGLDYDEDSGYFAMCGYQTSGASQVALVEKKTGKTVKRVNLCNQDGTINKAHAGGLTIHGDYLYLCHSSSGASNFLDVYSWSEIKNADVAPVKALGQVSLGYSDTDYLKPSWTTDYDDKIVIGEFYRAGNYETCDLHHLGDNKAIAVEFKFDATKTDTFGIDMTPLKAYSLPGLVQGAAFDDDYMYLSTSYGPAFSHIKFTDVKGTATGKATIFGTSVDYVNAITKKDIKIAPMSEEIEIVDGKMYTMCEAASNKYIFGKFTGAKWCYATDLSKYK